jgi:hypothetical protein
MIMEDHHDSEESAEDSLAQADLSPDQVESCGFLIRARPKVSHVIKSDDFQSQLAVSRVAATLNGGGTQRKRNTRRLQVSTLAVTRIL